MKTNANTNMFPSHMHNSPADADIAHEINVREHTFRATLRYSVGRDIVLGKRGNGKLVIFENSPDFLSVRGGRNAHEIIAEYDIRDSGDSERNRQEVKARFYRDFNPKKFGFVS